MQHRRLDPCKCFLTTPLLRGAHGPWPSVVLVPPSFSARGGAFWGSVLKRQQQVVISSSGPVLFGFFRTADLGQQYDTVSRIGGNFSFLFDTFILLYIIFGVVRSLSSQVGLPWFIPPRGILLCVGPHPKLISGSSLRGVVTRADLA